MKEGYIGTAFFLDRFKEWVDQGHKILLILGAGASVSSGIPSGGQLADRWLRRLHKRDRPDIAQFGEYIEWLGAEPGPFEGLEVSNTATYYNNVYSELFGTYPQLGHDEIQGLIQEGEPGLGYYVMAHLLIQRKITDVLTTNFDNLTETSIASISSTMPRVIGHETLVTGIESLNAVPSVFKIHRDAYFSPANITDQIVALREHWAPLLIEALPDYIPIVVGYGGNDEGLIKVLDSMDQSHFRRGIYWTTYGSEHPAPHVKNVIDKLRGNFVPTEGFDSFMLSLGQCFKFDVTKVIEDLKERVNEITKRLEEHAIEIKLQKVRAQHDTPQIELLMGPSSAISIKVPEVSGGKGIVQQIDEFITTPRLKMIGVNSFEEASDIFRTIANPDQIAFNIFLNKAADSGQARGVFEEMLGAGLEPDVTTYSTLINKTDTYQDARGVFEEMLGAGLEPNVTTDNSILKKVVEFDEYIDYLGILGDRFVHSGALQKKLKEVTKDIALDQLHLARILDANLPKACLLLDPFNCLTILSMIEAHWDHMVQEEIDLPGVLIGNMRRDMDQFHKARHMALVNKLQDPDKRLRAEAYFNLQYGNFLVAFEQFQQLIENSAEPKHVANYWTRCAECSLLEEDYARAKHFAWKAREVHPNAQSDQEVLIIATEIMAQTEKDIAQIQKDLNAMEIGVGKGRLANKVLPLIKGLSESRVEELGRFLKERYGFEEY